MIANSPNFIFWTVKYYFSEVCHRADITLQLYIYYIYKLFYYILLKLFYYYEIEILRSIIYYYK
jgi:hypothetical protein